LLSNILLIGLWSILVHKVYVSYLYDGNINPSAQLLYLWQHPWQIFIVIWRYLSGFGWSYVEQFVGMLGYLDTPQVLLLNIYFFVLLALPFFNSDHDVKVGMRHRLIMGGVFLLNFFVVLLSIYISSTEVGEKIVHGMRQRYLIPFVILFFATFHYREAFNAKIEHYKSWFLPIFSSTTLVITLLAMIYDYYM
jgi:uncharacterized membrane protein